MEVGSTSRGGSTCSVLPFWTRSTIAASGLPLPTLESSMAASKPALPTGALLAGRTCDWPAYSD